MTKSELIDRLAAQFPQLVAKDAELAVKMILDAMAESLAKGERIEIRGFGSFGLNYRPPRTGRNPKSGDKVQVPAKYVPHFKAGKELRERVVEVCNGLQRPGRILILACDHGGGARHVGGRVSLPCVAMAPPSSSTHSKRVPCAAKLRAISAAPRDPPTSSS